MKEIPMIYIKANQIAIVLFIVLAALLLQPVFIYVMAIIQILALLVGPKGNMIMRLVKPLLKSRVTEGETQAAELAKFNNSIAVILLTLSSVFFLIGWHMAAWAAAAMVAVAATAAVLGFCIGCTIYYQYKKWKHSEA